MKVRIRGISSQMNRFRYLYGIILGELLCWDTPTTWVEICSTRRFCHEGQQLKVVYVDEAVETLNGIRGDEQVDLFWTKVISKAGAVDMGEPALYLEEEKRPFDLMIYAVRRRLPWNNFDKEQIRVQLQLLDANFDVVTVYGAIYGYLHVKEYFLSLSQEQQSHFSSSFSSFLQRMLDRRDCSLCYDISKAIGLLAHHVAAGTSELSDVAARSQGWMNEWMNLYSTQLLSGTITSKTQFCAR